MANNSAANASTPGTGAAPAGLTTTTCDDTDAQVAPRTRRTSFPHRRAASRPPANRIALARRVTAAAMARPGR